MRPSCRMSISLQSPNRFLRPPCKSYHLEPPLRDPVRSRAENSRIVTRLSRSMEVGGLDSDGREFKNAQEMWREQVGEEGDENKKTQWYSDGVAYWEVSTIESTG